MLFFDSTPEVLTAVTATPGPQQLAEWDGGSAWRTVVPANWPPPVHGFTNPIAHDSVRLLYQQGFSLDPAATPPGLLPAAVRITIGRL
jgi:hypothetical protein